MPFGTAFLYIFIPVPVKLHASPHSGDVAAECLLAPFVFVELVFIDAALLALLFFDAVAAQRPSIPGLRLVPTGTDIQLHRLGVQAICRANKTLDIAEQSAQRRAH